MRQPNMAYRGVPARGYPIGPDNRRRPGRTGFSPFSRSTRFPFTSTASPPAPLAIRKAPSGRRRKSRRQSHKFFKHLLRLGTPTRRHALGRLPTPPPLPENLLSDCTKNCPLRPLRALRGFQNPKIGQQLGAQPTPRFRVMIEALIDALPPFTFCRPFSFDSKLIW